MWHLLKIDCESNYKLRKILIQTLLNGNPVGELLTVFNFFLTQFCCPLTQSVSSKGGGMERALDEGCALAFAAKRTRTPSSWGIKIKMKT